ncbi:glycosyl hydrolase family 39 [Klebsiella oxytoca]|uniref:Glycosyl hydrolase family 39 n=1 Tax=Klebsiella oxytoca TaxID=571 RepID=A0A318FQB1_KLEOX|nr:cellulase family glycosylhydrolase [Klebsiella oxytoca]PXW42879.1 glycosyl hydrolase family 39 [Klebsiella oxytoca]HCB1497652.1 cellulase family glycosylhydrolase [Klebsiella michiganensis]HCB1844863.1 cellulase family glycosylhydrolase [Klebsiella oxytoca]
MRFVYFLLIFVSFLVQGQTIIELDGSSEGAIFSKLKKSSGSLGVALGGGSKTLLEYKYYSTLQKLKPAGIRLEAVTADYRSLYDPVSRKWDYHLLDKELDQIDKSTFIIANIFYTPKFLSSCPNSKNYAYCPPKDINAWTDYVKNIVRHVYSKYGVKYWEIGNEPSGKNFFRAPLRDFFKFYILTAQAIKDINSDIMVGGYADNAYYVDAYYDFFKNIKERDPDLLNFVTFHWYGDWSLKSKYDPSEINSITYNIREKLTSLNMKNIPIFLTEWNLRAQGESPNGNDQITAYFIAMQYWIHISRINKAFFFRVEPYSNTKSSLLDSHGEMTQVGAAFFDMTDMLKNYDFQLKNIDDIYILFSASRKRIILSRYDAFFRGNKELQLIVIKVKCDAPAIYHDYSYRTDGKRLIEGSCNKNRLNVKLSLSNYQSGFIAY